MPNFSVLGLVQLQPPPAVEQIQEISAEVVDEYEVSAEVVQEE